MGLEPRRIEPGAPADFLLLPAETLAEAIVNRPQDREVWLKGVRQRP
jgi:cytosine deaminase